MKKLNPSVKTVTLILLTLELAVLKNYILNFSVFALSIIAVLISSKENFKKCVLMLIPIAVASLGMFFAGMGFSSGNGLPVSEKMMLLSDTRIVSALILSSRVLAFSGVIILFGFTTDRVQLIRSLNATFRLPNVFAYGLLSAYGIFPYMVKEYKTVMRSLKNRKIRVFPVSPKVLKPVLIKAVRWSEAPSVAMVSKGFTPEAKRNPYSVPKIGICDFVFSVLCISVPAIVNFLLI